jgi:cytochrome c biogenesis protein CcdA
MPKMSITKLATMGILLPSLFIILVSSSLIAISQTPDQVFIFGFPEYESSGKLSDYFDMKSGLIVNWLDLNDQNRTEEFKEIVNILVLQSVKVVPPENCTPCLLRKFSWQQIYEIFATPLVGFFLGERLVAISIAVTNHETLDQAFTNTNNGLKIFTQQETFTLTVDDRIQLEKIFNRNRTDTNILSILPMIIVAAAVDAINPCEFYVLIVLLSFIFFNISRKAVLKAGIAYSIAVFMIYYLMGFGLFRVIGYVEEARVLVVILGFTIGLRAVLNFIFDIFGLSLGFRDTIRTFLNKKFKRVPENLSKKLSNIMRSSKNPYGAFMIGIVASVFLLPCTSAPYLITLSLISNVDTQLEGILLLTVYNSIIITPFLAVICGIYLLKVKTSDLKKWSSKKQKWLNLVAGLLMILLSVYLISTIIT